MDNPDFVVLKFNAAEIVEDKKNLMIEETCQKVTRFSLPVAITRERGYFLP